MAEKREKLKNDAVPPKPRQRRLRADARQNIEALLQAAAEEFASTGVDVPVHEIAKKAGMGIGTLYRHFPTRSDLIVAVFHKDVEECIGALSALAANQPAGKALTRWVTGYVDFIIERRGLASAMNSGDPALKGLPAYFQQRLGPLLQDLLDKAAAEKAIITGVRAHELLHAVAMLCVPPSCGEPTDPKRMVGLFMDGLRYRISQGE